MSDRVNHCPFLNRADPRCAGHFSLDRLGVAFDHCFGKYKTCASYQELLLERRSRRGDLEEMAPLAAASGYEDCDANGDESLAETDDELRPAFAAFHLPVLLSLPGYEPRYEAAFAD
jgi:hypothetical protein